MKTAVSSKTDKEPVSHNLLGQRLGRKGRDTRERILLAAQKLLAAPPGTAVTLSAVAREASLAMTTLYLYFSDLTELLIAVMEPVMASAEESYVGLLRAYWPDEALGERCLEFLESFHAFWVKHARILHMSLGDSVDERIIRYRTQVTRRLIDLFVGQMGARSPTPQSPEYLMGTVLLAGMERMISAATDVNFPRLVSEDPERLVRGLLTAEARLLELAIIDGRARARAAAAAS